MSDLSDGSDGEARGLAERRLVAAVMDGAVVGSGLGWRATRR